MKSNIIVLLLLIACAGNPLVCLARREVTTHKINLDISPQERYNKLIPHFNETVWGFYNKYFANDKILTGVLYGLVDARGPENAEQQGEIEGLGTQSGLPLKFVRGVQFLYELSTLMVPIKNLTRIATNTVVSGNQQYGMDYIPKEYAPLKKKSSVASWLHWNHCKVRRWKSLPCKKFGFCTIPSYERAGLQCNIY